jgi:hypothetical protein
VCTTELGRAAKLYPEFEKRGVKVKLKTPFIQALKSSSFRQSHVIQAKTTRVGSRTSTPTTT